MSEVLSMHGSDDLDCVYDDEELSPSEAYNRLIQLGVQGDCYIRNAQDIRISDVDIEANTLLRVDKVDEEFGVHLTIVGSNTGLDVRTCGQFLWELDYVWRLSNDCDKMTIETEQIIASTQELVKNSWPYGKKKVG